EKPKDVMVLTAIANDKKDEKSISKYTRLTPFEAASVMERLILAGLVERREKQGFLGAKNILVLTEKGARELSERRLELEQRYQKMVMVAKRGDKNQFEDTVAMNRSWIPAMMFWMSMLSMMGMTMGDTMPDGYDAGVSDGGDSLGDLGDLVDISF
ncbi:MAG: hypothetical protein ACE5JV_02445, partial [Nitrososphaerales archaeon]